MPGYVLFSRILLFWKGRWRLPSAFQQLFLHYVTQHLECNLRGKMICNIYKIVWGNFQWFYVIFKTHFKLIRFYINYKTVNYNFINNLITFSDCFWIKVETAKTIPPWGNTKIVPCSFYWESDKKIACAIEIRKIDKKRFWVVVQTFWLCVSSMESLAEVCRRMGILFHRRKLKWCWVKWF